MMNSYSNKIIKESFRSERGDHSIRIEEKPRDNIKSAKLVRTNSVQNSKMYFTNREKTTVSLKGKLFPQKTSNYSFIKKEFKTPKDPLKIKIQKIAKSPIKNIKIKTEFKTKLNSAKTEKKVVDAKNIKNLNSLNIERQSSNKLLSNRVK